MGRHQSYGGHSERETPGPIPNPEVKPFSADGTATGRLWESRTSPDILLVRATPRVALTALWGRLVRRGEGAARGWMAWRRNEEPAGVIAGRPAPVGAPARSRAPAA